MSRVLFIQADSRLLNPQLDAQMIAEAYADDAEAAKSEWGGEFRSDVSEYLSDELIDAAIAEGRTHIEPRPGVVYAAFTDCSSGSGSDAAALAIAHAERDDEGSVRYVQDLLIARWPPFSPERVCEEFSGALARYGLSRVVGDKYAQGWLPAAFARYGVTYEYSEHDRSSVYGSAAKLFVERRVELLDDAKLITQLRTLERKPRSGGRQDLIDSPRNAHEDLANATCGALLLVAERELRDPVIDEQIAIEATLRAEPDTRCRPRVLGLIFDGDRVVIAKRMGRLALPPVIATGNPHELAGRIAREASAWSAFSIYIADVSPGQPVLPILLAMNLSVQQVDLFGGAPSETYLDLRTALAFDLAEWLKHATVPPTLLHELTGIAFTTKRGVTELLDSPVGVCDALALTLLERAEFQDPRAIAPVTNITHAICDDGRWGGPAAPHQQRRGLTEPYDLGAREPSLQRDGWSRVLPTHDSESTLRDYDVLRG